MTHSICIFGDSTARGAWDMEKGGWVNRLWFYIGNREGKNYITTYNCSVDGGTTRTIFERFEGEARARDADALIFQTGGNDASYKNAPEDYLVPPHEFRSNVEEIIRRAKNITNNIIFMDLKNCDESKTMPVPWGIYYANKNLKKYSEIMKEVCKKNGALFLDIKPLETSDFDDGLHPNTKGHAKIFVQARDFLEKIKWI